jgi:uncharacterized protein (TIGR01244 family)
MDIRPLTPDYAVSPQIQPSDMAAIRAAGFVAVIDNRPDLEVPPELQAEAMRAAAEAAGLEFVVNPIAGRALTQANVAIQAATLAQATGPVFAYCYSGTRSALAWGLAQAGKRPLPEILQLAARQGYDLSPLAPEIEALSRPPT